MGERDTSSMSLIGEILTSMQRLQESRRYPTLQTLSWIVSIAAGTITLVSVISTSVFGNPITPFTLLLLALAAGLIALAYLAMPKRGEIDWKRALNDIEDSHGITTAIECIRDIFPDMTSAGQLPEWAKERLGKRYREVFEEIRKRQSRLRTVYRYALLEGRTELADDIRQDYDVFHQFSKFIIEMIEDADSFGYFAE